MKLPKDAQGLAAATVGYPDDTIVVVTNRGKAKSMRLGLAPQAGRSTKGDYIISMSRANEVVSAVVRLEPRLALPAFAAEPPTVSGSDNP